MKKVAFAFALAFASVSVAPINTFAAPAANVVLQDDGEKREKITAEELPSEVVTAWTQGANGQAQVSEINKVTKGEEVYYEVTYASADGSAQKAKFKADGTEVKEEQKQ